MMCIKINLNNTKVKKKKKTSTLYKIYFLTVAGQSIIYWELNVTVETLLLESQYIFYLSKSSTTNPCKFKF